MRLFNTDTVPLYLMETPPGTPAMFGFTYLLVPSVLTTEAAGRLRARHRQPQRGDQLAALGCRRDVLGGPVRSLARHPARILPEELPRANRRMLPPRRAAESVPADADVLPARALGWEQETDSYLHPDEYQHATDDDAGAGRLQPARIHADDGSEVDDQRRRRAKRIRLPSASAAERRSRRARRGEPEGRPSATLPAGADRSTRPSANGLGSCASSGDRADHGDRQSADPLHTTARPLPRSVAARARWKSSTPLLENPLKGAVYLADAVQQPLRHADRDLHRGRWTRGAGIVVKIPARISPDPNTGRSR